jgi:hypothetical protein
MIWAKVTIANTTEGEIDNRVLSTVEDDAEFDRAIFAAAVELMNQHWPLRIGDTVTVHQIDGPPR